MSISNDEILVTPLGGLGQIGSNMCLFEGQDESILIDSGLLFPRESSTGIQYLIPNFYQIDRTKLKALFISHCHEDHIGALGHLLEFIPGLKIYTELYTAKVIGRKFSKVALNLEIINPEFDIDFKNFNVSSFRVNHSTAQTLGFIVKNKKRSLIFSSDFKVDTVDSEERSFDFNRINQITKGTQKVSFIDSTNILNDKKTLAETEILANLKEYISRDQRKIITFFPSNVYRFLSIIKICNESGKIPVLYGRSMHFYYQCAQEANLIKGKGYEVQDIEHVNTRSKSVVLLVSGCQGNFRSTLHNIAMGQSPLFTLKADDLFIYSASIIPGNDKQVYKVFNLFTEQGATIKTSKDKPIHCSGHPGQEDLKIYLDQVRPDVVIPIHGESYFLKKHQEFLAENYPKIKSHLVFNHSSLSFGDRILTKVNEPLKPIMITFKNRRIEPQSVSERRRLGENGIFILALGKNDIDFRSFGMDLEASVEETITNTINKFTQKKRNLEDLRIKIRKILSDNLGHKPHVEIIDVR